MQYKDTKCYILSVTVSKASIWTIAVKLKVNTSKLISLLFPLALSVCCNELLLQGCNLFSQHLYEKNIPAGHKLCKRSDQILHGAICYDRLREGYITVRQ